MCTRFLAVLLLALMSCSDNAAPAAPDMRLPDDMRAPLAPDMALDMRARDMRSAQDMAPAAPVTLSSGAASLSIDPGARQLTLMRAQSALFVLPVDGIQLGVVSSLSERASYDPYGFLSERAVTKPPLDAWLELEHMRIESLSASSARLALSFDGGVLATLKITASASDRFELELVPADATGDAIAYYRLAPRVSPTEGFYGLGEYFDAVSHRGKVRAMQLEVEEGVESGYNEAHVPIPLLTGTSGWGMFIASEAPGVWGVATQADDRVDAIFGPGKLAQQGLRFYLFAEAHPLDLTRHYYAITGQLKLPAPWALGPIIWRDENEDQAQVLRDAETMRELDLAASGYWIDRPYASAVNTFDFSADMFDDPAAMIARLNELGLRVALWHTPYLDESSPATAQLRAHATQHNYYPPRHGLRLNGWGKLVDFTNPAAQSWWQENLSEYKRMGIEGFKLDYGEDIIPDALGMRVKWEFFDGSDERTMHAAYQRLYHQTYAQALDMPQGHFLLCRAGTWGDQVHGVIIWPGDLDANMALHGEQVTKADGSTYVAVGGLPAALIAGTGLGPSGFPFYGSDTGGYRHSPPNKETFTRWFQHTALSTVMQIGTSTNDVAWEFRPENGFDAQMLDWYREYTRLHLRLWPYLWSYAQRLLEDGRPIQRALGLAYPELGEHPDFIYMLGDSLLVAPVVRAGDRHKQVIFPEGEWIDWWTHERVQGGVTRTVDAPLSTLPLYLMAGGIVPMLRPGIDTLAPTTQPERVDSYESAAGRLWALMGAGGTGRFEVFDGSVLSLTTSGAMASVSVKGGEVFRQGMHVEVVGMEGAPVQVWGEGVALERATSLAELEQLELGWFAQERVLHVRLPAGEHTVSFEVP